MPFRLKGYNEAINEYFNIKDDQTRKILLSIDEADQNQVLTNLTSKLYDNIVQRVDDIDFGTIPETKGDITKLENYDKLSNCVQLIHDLLHEYKQDMSSIKVIEEAFENVKDRTALWEKGYALNIEFIIVTYNAITLAIVSSISFMISSCIEFIKSSSDESFNAIVDKVALSKTKDNLLFNDLAKFNKACEKNHIDNSLNFLVKKNVKNFSGLDAGMIAGGVAIVGILLNIIPIIRELIFFFYYSRVRVSDYFEIQADLLQMNSYNLQSNETMPKKDRDRIVKKQSNIVALFRKIANTVSIKNKEGEVKTAKDVQEISKDKYKYDDVSDTMPDSASSALF